MLPIVRALVVRLCLNECKQMTLPVTPAYQRWPEVILQDQVGRKLSTVQTDWS
jgi:hypothetical protein